MNYKELQQLSYFINNTNIDKILFKVGKEQGFNDFYISGLRSQYYRNPIGFMSSHIMGEQMFQEITEAIKSKQEVSKF